MAEILLIFPPDKEAAAGRIEAALASAGHEALLEPVAGADGEAIARKASGRAAALLIWSRPLAAAADLGQWPAALRRLPNLIEVSTDGIAPQSGDERRVVLLSGWRGQPFHLGWQRLLDELEKLGARRSAKPRPVSAPAAAAPAPAPGARAPAGSAVPARGRRLALPAAAALALLGAVGGAAWIGSKASDPAPPSRPSPPAAAPAPAPPPEAAIETGAGPARAAAPSATAAPESPPTPQAGPSRPVRAASAPKRRPAAEPPLKRYSKKHSKTMRLFCARSGRSTPQCRTFARSMAADR